MPANTPRELPSDYQPFSDKQRRLRRSYGGGDRSPAARDAHLDYAKWRRLYPDIELPKLPPLNDDGAPVATVPVEVADIAPIVHGTPEGAARGCKGSNCDNHGDPDLMTCEQAKIRYAGDYGYRRAVDAGTATAFKDGHEPVRDHVQPVTAGGHPTDPANVTVVSHGSPAAVLARPGKPKTSPPAPRPVPEIRETSIDLVIDTTAVDAAREVFELQEPPIGDEAPIDEETVDALTALQKRYDQVRLDLINAEQALREQKTIHGRDVDAWTRERDHLSDEVIPELKRQITLANAVTATTQQEIEQLRAQLERERRDHAAYTALAGAPLNPRTHDGTPIEGTWAKAWIFDPSPQPSQALPKRSPERPVHIARRSRQIRRTR